MRFLAVNKGKEPSLSGTKLIRELMLIIFKLGMFWTTKLIAVKSLKVGHVLTSFLRIFAYFFSKFPSVLTSVTIHIFAKLGYIKE